jgi:hypothetical protein
VDWLPFRELGSTKTTRAARRSKEVYWLNTFSDDEAGLSPTAAVDVSSAGDRDCEDTGEKDAA